MARPQLWRGDLKVEFDSMEFWLKDLPGEHERLQIGDVELRMVSLQDLKELYRRGFEETARHDDAINQKKHAAIENKFALLEGS